MGDSRRQAEELTLEAVYRRAYQISDQGDSQGRRMSSGVVWDNILVEVQTKGAAPEWIHEQLKRT